MVIYDVTEELGTNGQFTPELGLQSQNSDSESKDVSASKCGSIVEAKVYFKFLASSADYCPDSVTLDVNLMCLFSEHPFQDR